MRDMAKFIRLNQHGGTAVFVNVDEIASFEGNAQGGTNLSLTNGESLVVTDAVTTITVNLPII